MREFLLTSTAPYWILFVLSLASAAICFLAVYNNKDNDEPANQSMWFSKNMMYGITGIMLAVALIVIIFYSMLGGNALWWITGKEISYWSKLLRLIPLIVFLAAQAAAPFAYNFYMESFFDGKKLSVKSQFISLVVIIPVTLIIMLICSSFIDTATRNVLFYIIAGVGLIGAAIYSAKKNIGSAGVKFGLIYTVTSFILCAATLVTLLYFLVALFSLILEMLPVIATIIAISIIFGKSYGNAVMGRDSAGNYIASDGSKHSSQSARDSRNSQINAQRNNQ